MIKSYNIHAISTALSPITQMSGTNGNEALINREDIVYNNEIRKVPVISGNAIRHKMIRESGVYHIVKVCELEGDLTLEQANYLFTGGSLTEKSTTENIATIAEMQELLPLMRLLGGSLRNQIVSGSLICKRGILVCEENRSRLNKFLPLELSKLKFAEEFITSYQYTRGDASNIHGMDSVAGEEIKERTKNLMIYSGQAVAAGASFYHGFDLTHVGELELGGLLNALIEWNECGGVIGGQSRIGHGKLNTILYVENEEVSMSVLVSNYRNYIYDNRQKIKDWLFKTFPADETKEKKSKKVKNEESESASLF